MTKKSNSFNPIPKSLPKIYLLGCIISLCGFYFGFTLTEYNNFFEYFMLGKFKESIPQSQYHYINSWLNTFVTLGGLLSVIVSGLLLKRVSLKKIVIGTCLLHIFARSGMIFANVWFLYFCRFCIGFVICLNSFTCPIYIADLVPKKFIGFLGSCYVAFMSFGIIAAMFMKFSWTKKYWWFVTLIPAFLDFIRVIFIGLIFNLESPKSILKNTFKSEIRISRISNFEGLLGLTDTEAESVETSSKQSLINPEEDSLKQHPQIQRYLKSIFHENQHDMIFSHIFKEFKKQFVKKEHSSMLNLMFNKSYLSLIHI